MLRKRLNLSLASTLRAPSTLPASYRFFSSSSLRQNVLNELESRGMLQDLTSRAARKHVEKPTTVYLGVDPSANSLHVGNLLALIGLLHFRLQGHNAIALVSPGISLSFHPEAIEADKKKMELATKQIGGATGSIGDPSGRSTERNALSTETLEANVAGITQQLTTFLDRGVAFAQSRTRTRGAATSTGDVSLKGTEGEIKIENNMKWIGGMSLLEFLSKVGKMARVSTMLSRESVKSRLDSSSGISFTEFSYQLLQAYDFLTLHRLHNCTIQLGGSDQLGNIVSGIDMIRRSKFGDEETKDVDDPAFGVTFPLLTTSSGEKFGKSAGNAIWLDPKMTSPFDVYQFFLRTTDEEVEKYLKIFTFIRVVEIKGIMEDHKAQPSSRIAQKVLAAEATELIHGSEGLQQALAATKLFYTSTDSLPALVDDAFIEALDGASATSTIPSMLVKLRRDDIFGEKAEKIAIESGLFSSKTQARKAIEGGTLQINGTKIPAKNHQRKIEEGDLLNGRLIVLKSGKSGNKAVLLE